MILADVRNAIVARWIAGAFGLTTFYQGKSWEPIAGTRHARLFVLPAPTDGVALGNTGYDRLSGIAQVDLMYPPNQGDATILAKADAVAAYFQRGQSQTSGSASVQFRGTSIGQTADVDGWLRCIVTINWFADYNRSV